MSDYLAIGAVTSVLAFILERELLDEVLGVPSLKVTTKAPHAISTEENEAGLNIFLYQISLNSGYANYDLPRRDSRGRLISKPLVGLDLHYLLTPFSGQNDEIVIQQILGSTIRILHENPILTKEMIKETLKSIEESNPNSKIPDSDIAEQSEKIKVIYKPLSLEEITKIWSSNVQTNYRLSVTYLATVILIDGKEEPIRPLPVQERKIFVRQLRYPIIEQIEPYILQWDPNPANMKIDIIGKNLSSDKLKVTIDGSEIVPDLVSVISNERITVKIPSDLHAGIKTLKLLHGLSIDNNTSSVSQHLAFESNNSYFILAPRLMTNFPVEIIKGTDLALDFKPPLKENQKVEIMIGENIFSHRFEVDQTFPTESLEIKTDKFIDGRSLFRMRIDGGESFLLTDQNENSPTFKKYIGPIINVKIN
jgi:hypothetical protein